MDAWYNRGVLLLAVGEPARAAMDFSRALGLDPFSARVLNNRGIAWLQLGDRTRALADFDAALAADPRHEGARRNRQRLQGEMGGGQ